MIQCGFCLLNNMGPPGLSLSPTKLTPNSALKTLILPCFSSFITRNTVWLTSHRSLVTWWPPHTFPGVSHLAPEGLESRQFWAPSATSCFMASSFFVSNNLQLIELQLFLSQVPITHASPFAWLDRGPSTGISFSGQSYLIPKVLGHHLSPCHSLVAVCSCPPVSG